MSTGKSTLSELLTKEESDGKKLFILWYRAGMNPHPLFKVFSMDSMTPFRAVIQRSKDHCTAMGVRFINVYPFFSNLDQEERRRYGVDDSDSISVADSANVSD